MAFFNLEMQISFNNVIPHYLEKEKIQSSGLWGRTFTVEKGNFVQVVAPSGRGKSSLTHFIYGLRNDYEGSISIAGTGIKDINAEKISKLRRETISIIFQDLRLFTGNTVEENLVVKRDLEPYEGSADFRQMAERLGIEKKLKQKAGICSYGEQQRVAIIRALLQPFDFLIMDEPFSHLDQNNRQRALELIMEECTKRNAGIILLDLQSNPHFSNSAKIDL